MGLGFADFLFQRLMPFFELRKMRLNGHARFLLMSKVPNLESLQQSGHKSTPVLDCAPQQCGFALPGPYRA
jgi:hypothetical protein